MSDVNYILRGKFDHEDVTAIVNLMKATTFSSADKIHIYLTGRRAKINNFFFRILAKKIADSGITLAEGALGTKLSEFPMSSVSGAATETTGISYDETTDSLWLCDFSAQTVFNTAITGGAPLSSFPFSAFGAAGENIQGISIDPSGNLWMVSLTTNNVYKTDQSGTLLGVFLLTNFVDSTIQPVDISYSEIDNKLWIVGENIQKILKLELNGKLISQINFPKINGFTGNIRGISISNNKIWAVDGGFDRVLKLDLGGNIITSFPVSAFDAAATNNSGISVTNNGTTWIVDENTNKVYNIAGTDIKDLLNNGTIVLHTDNGFNKRVGN